MNTIIEKFKSVYGKLDASNISLVDTIYDDNIIFVDPFHEIRGLRKLSDYFSDLYKNLESCEFEFGDVYSKTSSAFIVWNMTFRHRSLSRDIIEVPGSTQIRFDEKIYFQRDYFDAGKMIYEKLWMNDDLYNLLKWQWEHRHPTSPFVFCHMNPKSKFYGQPFVARWKLLKSLCKTAGVEPFGYHDIRHTVAKYLNDLQKVGLKKVQQVLRHRRQATTEIYLEGNYTDTEKAMKLLELKYVRKIG